jgi:choline monooxygenase
MRNGSDGLAGFVNDEVLAGLARPTSEAVPLPARLYADPEFARLENERLFARSWLCAGYAHEVPGPGDTLPVTVAGCPIVFVRGRDGEVRAFLNICPHRGNVVVAERQWGTAALRCRYHGWTFGLNGGLAVTPHWGGYGRAETPGFDRACRGLSPVRLARWHDWLFVNLSGDAPPFEQVLAPFAARCSEYDLGRVVHAHTAPFSIGANWKLVEENFLEVLHLPTTHPGLNAVAPFQNHAMVSEGALLGTIIEVGLPASWAEPALPRFPGLAPDNRTAKNLALFPNFKLVIGPDHCASMVEHAEAADRTSQRWDFYFVGEEALAERYAAARQAIIDFFVRTNEEDVGVLEDMQRACSSLAPPGCFSGAWETVVHDFQKHVIAALR